MRTRKTKYTQKQYRLYDYNTNGYQINPDGTVDRKENGFDSEGYYSSDIEEK